MKITAFLLSLTLLLFHLPVTGFSQDMPAETPLSPGALEIPESLGKVETRFKGNSEFWIVHIQDVHAHLTAQENIASILNYLNEVYGIETAAVEGGWGTVRLTKSWGLPSSMKKQTLARSLLEDHYLTGPGYAALLSPHPMELTGIEEKELYQENHRLYRDYLEAKDAAGKKLSDLKSELESKKTAVYNERLLEFDRRVENSRNDSKTSPLFLALFQYLEKENIDVTDLGQFSLFKKAYDMERLLDAKKLESEAGRLKAAFAYHNLSFEELLRSGIIPEDKLGHYPEARKYLALMHLKDSIDSQTFGEETDTVVSRIKKALITSAGEAELDQAWERYVLASKIITLTATPGDLFDFSKQPESILSDMAGAGLADDLSLGLAFYDKARSRDDVFFSESHEIALR